jgi:hypothetical protein
VKFSSSSSIGRVATTLLALWHRVVRHSWLSACCRYRPCRRWIFRRSRCRPRCRRQSGDHGRHGGHAARARARAHRRRHRDDLVEFARLDPHHAAVRADRNIDGAARDVQAAINARATCCRRDCRAIRPTARSIRPMRRS